MQAERLARIPWRLTWSEDASCYRFRPQATHYRVGQRLLEPAGDEAGAGVDVHGFVTTGSGSELMRCLSRGDENLTGTSGHLAGTDGEGRAAAPDDERLRVRMLMQPRAEVGLRSGLDPTVTVCGTPNPRTHTGHPNPVGGMRAGVCPERCRGYAFRPSRGQFVPPGESRLDPMRRDGP